MSAQCVNRQLQMFIDTFYIILCVNVVPTVCSAALDQNGVSQYCKELTANVTSSHNQTCDDDCKQYLSFGPLGN